MHFSRGPGIDAVPLGEFEYGSMQEFMRGVDILVSSGVPVTIKNDDFAGWYEQFVVAATERHLTVQIVSSAGRQENMVCDFGGRSGVLRLRLDPESRTVDLSSGLVIHGIQS